MSIISVHVQSGTFQRQIHFPIPTNATLTCGEIKHELHQEFGAGILCPADNKDVRLVQSSPLIPGHYLYTVIPAPGFGLNAGFARSSHAMQQWGAALKQAVVVDRCLAMAPEVGEGLPAALRGPLFVRPCYERLWRKELQPMLGPGQPSACVITGTPGIGKSKFVVWIMKHLAAEGQLVYYQTRTEAGTAWYKWDFSHSQISASFISDGTACHEDLQKPTTWLIIDGPPPDNVQYTGLCNCVVLSSPSDSNFHTYLKGRNSRLRYMPVWRLEELEACRQRLYPGVAAGHMQDRFAWVGGTIRKVLVQVEDDPKHCIEAAMPDGEKAAAVLQALGAPVGRAAFSHTLGHFVVGSDFKPRAVCLASPKVADLLLSIVLRSERMKVQQFLVAAQDSPQLAGLRGLLFEAYGHRVLQVGNRVCKARQLVKPAEELPADASNNCKPVDASLHSHVGQAGDDDEDCMMPHHYSNSTSDASQQEQQHAQAEGLEARVQALVVQDTLHLPGPLQHKWDSPGLELADLQDTYLQPASCSNAAWDAVVCSPQPLILQYTVSTQHGVNAQPIMQLLQRFGEQQQKAARLVFIVPPDVFPMFQWQKWQTVRGTPRQKVPHAIEGMTQWVMELKVEAPSPRASRGSGNQGSSGNGNRRQTHS